MDPRTIQETLTRHVCKGWDATHHGPVAGAWTGDQIDHAARLADLIDLLDATVVEFIPDAMIDLLGDPDADTPTAMAVIDADNVAVFDIHLTRRRLIVGGRVVMTRDIDAGTQVSALVVGLIAQTLGRSPRRARREREVRA